MHRLGPPYPAVMMTIGRCAAAGGLDRCPENGVHLRPQHAQRMGAPASDHGVVPGGADSAEERHATSSSAWLPENCEPHRYIVQLPVALVVAVLVLAVEVAPGSPVQIHEPVPAGH